MHCFNTDTVHNPLRALLYAIDERNKNINRGMFSYSRPSLKKGLKLIYPRFDKLIDPEINVLTHVLSQSQQGGTLLGVWGLVLPANQKPYTYFRQKLSMFRTLNNISGYFTANCIKFLTDQQAKETNHPLS